MFTKKNKKGSAISLALVILGVASILFLGLMNYVLSQINYSSQVQTREAALHVADAGLNAYRWYLAHETEGMYIQEIQDFWDSSPKGVGENLFESDYEDGTYSVTVEPPENGSVFVKVTSVGWMKKNPSLKRTIEATLKLRSWSEYAILANSDIVIEDGEEVNGLIHSNGGIRFDGVAHNEVTSAVSDYFDSDSGTIKSGVWTAWEDKYNDNMNSNVFLGGKSFPVPEKDFDSVITSFSMIFNEAQNLNLDFGNATKAHQIILKGDVLDINRVINEKNGVVTKVQNVYSDVALPDVGAIYVNKNIWIEGTLGAGKKLVVAANNPSVAHGNIYISNDVIYENYTSDTVLGLVAKNNIEVVEDSEDDLRIDAALLAQLGSVKREDYGDTKNKITVYGAIATNQDYGFKGYLSKEIIFDSNLILSPPPFFPIEGIYRLDFWNEL